MKKPCRNMRFFRYYSSMHTTSIFLDDDFEPESMYRSMEAEYKMRCWFTWAEKNLSEKDKKEIAKAMKKM